MEIETLCGSSFSPVVPSQETPEPVAVNPSQMSFVWQLHGECKVGK